MYCQFKAALCLLKCLQQTTVEKCWDFPTLCCLFHQYGPPSKLPLSSLQSHGERRQSGDFSLPLSLSFRTMLQGLVRQFTPVSLAPRKLMQEDQKCEASLGYIMSSWPIWAIRSSLKYTKTKTKKHRGGDAFRRCTESRHHSLSLDSFVAGAKPGTLVLQP